jgi:hypothetical protein
MTRSTTAPSAWASTEGLDKMAVSTPSYPRGRSVFWGVHAIQPVQRLREFALEDHILGPMTDSFIRVKGLIHLLLEPGKHVFGLPGDPIFLKHGTGQRIEHITESPVFRHLRTCAVEGLLEDEG